MRNATKVILLALFVLAVLLGIRISDIQDADIEDIAEVEQTPNGQYPTPGDGQAPDISQEKSPVYPEKVEVSTEAPASEEDPDDVPEHLKIPGERVVTFKCEDALNAFIAEAVARGYTIRDIIPGLLAVRVGIGSQNTWAALPDGGSSAPNLWVSVPTPEPAPDPRTTVYTPIGGALLRYLGSSGDPSQRGAGVTVAVLDTLAQAHPALEGRLTVASGYTGALTSPQGSAGNHGTAVAALLAGNDPLAPGIAQAAQVLNVPVLDSKGQTDAFTLAKAILEATNAGAQIINMSLGTYGHSPVLEDAVNYASERDVALVAAAGNDGLAQVAYPAAYEGVIAVGANDANRWRTEFSNTGSVDITAPGYGVFTAQGTDSYAAFSGTSASAPIVSGAIALVLSQEPSLGAQGAVERVLELADDAGAPGYDSEYGHGTLNLDRLLNDGNADFADMAVAGYWPADDGTIYALVQNRGNRTEYGQTLEVKTKEGSLQLPLAPLEPGWSRAVPIPGLGQRIVQTPGGLRVVLQVEGADANPANNRYETTLSLLPAKAP